MEDIKSIGIDSPDYPEALKAIHDAPKTLYYIGTLPGSEERLIAVVGTRRPTPYGKQAAMDIAGRLANSGTVVVSGLAPGIDTLAHQAVVDTGKRTIAVMGTGLDEKSFYPKENLRLARSILAHGGCLMSELPPGTAGSHFTFPKRNRIVSGLSAGVVVIEAKEKSGSLITASYAKKYGKPLFAVPGPIYSMNSMGTNRLIQAGAHLALSARDILAQLGILQKPDEPQPVAAEPENEQERLILSALAQEQLTADGIIKKTNLSAQEVSATLALMEISGKIRNLGNNQYSLS